MDRTAAARGPTGSFKFDLVDRTTSVHEAASS